LWCLNSRVSCGKQYGPVIGCGHTLGQASGIEAKGFYHADTRAAVANEIATSLTTNCAKRGVIVEQLPLRNIQLPKRLTEVRRR